MGASWATSRLYRDEPSNRTSWVSWDAAVLWGSAASSLPCNQVEVPPITISLPVLFWFRTASLLQIATPFERFLLIKWQKGIPFPTDPSLRLLPTGEGEDAGSTALCRQDGSCFAVGWDFFTST